MTKWARAAIVSTLAVVAGAITAAPAGAQALGYGIAGPAGYSGFFGSSTLLVHAAGGGEFGLLANADGGMFVTSVNGVFHFVPSVVTPIKSRISPFASGGYTRLSSGEGAFDAWNLGGGADLWLKPRVGLRVEFRDHIRPDGRGGVQYWAYRVGVVFR